MAGEIPLIGSLLGGLGGLFGSGGGISGKETRGNWREAVRGVETAGNDLLGNGDPNQPRLVDSSQAYRDLVSALLSFSQDPFTYGPGIAEQQKAGYADQAWNAYRSALNQSDEQAAQSGQFRGSARANRSNALAQQLGQSIAGNNRNVDLAARQTRSQDLGQLGTLLSGLFNLRLQPAQAAAAIKTNTGGIPQASNPFASLLQGIGTLSTAVGTAPGGFSYNPSTGRYEQQGSLFNQFFANAFGGGSNQSSGYRGDPSGSYLPGY